MQVALDDIIKQDAHQRQQLREAHVEAIAAQANKHEVHSKKLCDDIKSLKDSKDCLRDRYIAIKAKSLWGNDSSLQYSMFCRWRQMFAEKIIQERDNLQNVVVSINYCSRCFSCQITLLINVLLVEISGTVQ